jgi:hypothetical protein
MNASDIRPNAKHRVWPWLAGLFLLPWVAVAFLVLQTVQLDRDATALRRLMVAATGETWHTKVQLTVGPAVLAAVRAGTASIHDLPVEARQALRAVRSASVGVYERAAGHSAAHHGNFAAAVDATMARRGWTRIVGVEDHEETVLIYLPAGESRNAPSRVCLAVCDRGELVVVAADFDADALADLVAREIGGQRSWRL